MKYRSTIQIKGKQIPVEAFMAEGQEYVVTGKLFRIARAKAEWDADIKDPESVLSQMKALDVHADIFTFMQRLPQIDPIYNYRWEPDNVAAIPISTYDQWWTKQITQEARNKVRKSRKKGVLVRLVEFNDEFVQRILEIYQESPLRQGVPFTHYHKRFNDAKKANSTYLERSEFIGAFLEHELVGFVKLVHTTGYTRVMGILGKQKHRDKAVMNALIAKAVELCAQKNIPFFTYGKMVYGSKGADSVAKFKQENGFKMYMLPRYFVPITLWGKIIIKLNIHRNIQEIMPRKLALVFLKTRRILNEKLYGYFQKK